MAAGDGLVSMTPSSIAHSGTSASINADGGVDFTAVTSLSLNGVFTSDYDNYLIVVGVLGSAAVDMWLRLRLAGSDATGSDYVRQSLNASSTSVLAARTTDSKGKIGFFSSVGDAGSVVHMYGPALAQPTAFRSVAVSAGSGSGAALNNDADTHGLSNAYDGITIYPNSGDVTGNVHVFGYEE